ncbi:MAG: LysR family transcriptional regulator, partial [Pyramidobacter sp.]|nr:LysR family transcriptional regulator [Pyramidobacter sp.]
MEQEMRYIWEIWREGSFSKAAEKLYLSQPALSMAVSKVERALGAQIFDRSRRPPSLTPAGEIYIETVREALRLESEMKRRIADIRELNAGQIRIGGSHYVNAFILPDVLASFGRAYPKIELGLLEHSSAHLARLLEQREIDLVFSANASLVKKYEHVPAFRDRLLLAVPEGQAPAAAQAAALTVEQIIAGAHRRDDCPQ